MVRRSIGGQTILQPVCLISEQLTYADAAAATAPPGPVTPAMQITASGGTHASTASAVSLDGGIHDPPPSVAILLEEGVLQPAGYVGSSNPLPPVIVHVKVHDWNSDWHMTITEAAVSCPPGGFVRRVVPVDCMVACVSHGCCILCLSLSIQCGVLHVVVSVRH